MKCGTNLSLCKHIYYSRNQKIAAEAQHGAESVFYTIRQNFYFSLINLIEVGEYKVSREYCVLLNSHVEVHSRDKRNKYVQKAVECIILHLDGKYRQCITKFEDSISIYDNDFDGPTQIHMANVKFIVLQKCLWSCIGWGKKSKYENITQTQSMFINTYPDRNNETFLVLESIRLASMVEDADSADDSLATGMYLIGECEKYNSMDEQEIAIAVMKHCMGRVYLWRLNEVATSRRLFVESYKIMQQHYVRHDIRTLDVLLDVFLCDVFERNEVEALLTKDFLAQSFEILLTQEQDTPSNEFSGCFMSITFSMQSFCLRTNGIVWRFSRSAQTRISNHQKRQKVTCRLFGNQDENDFNIEKLPTSIAQHRMGNIRQRNICLKCAINAALPNEPKSHRKVRRAKSSWQVEHEDFVELGDIEMTAEHNIV